MRRRHESAQMRQCSRISRAAGIHHRISGRPPHTRQACELAPLHLSRFGESLVGPVTMHLSLPGDCRRRASLFDKAGWEGAHAS